MESVKKEENQQQSQIRLCDIEIKDKNTAFELVISFLVLAQQRGAYNFEESSKIHECIRMFHKKSEN